MLALGTLTRLGGALRDSRHTPHVWQDRSFLRAGGIWGGLIVCLWLVAEARLQAEEPDAGRPAYLLEITPLPVGSGGLLQRLELPEAWQEHFPVGRTFELQPVAQGQQDTSAAEQPETLLAQVRAISGAAENKGTRRELIWPAPETSTPPRAQKYRVVSAGKAAHQAPFRLEEQNGAVHLLRGKQSWFVYHRETVSPPAGVNPLYQRSGYMHPVYSPRGRVVSDDFAPDHYHQHGLFFAWVNTTFRGRPVDFWNQAKGQGTVRHAELLGQQAGPVSAELSVRLQHLALDREQPDEDRAEVVLEETWQIVAHPAEEYLVWELCSVQKNVTDQPLHLQQYHYGGFGFRGAREWIAPAGKIPGEFLTSRGKNRQAGNHTSAEWVALFGPVPEAATDSKSPATEAPPQAGVVIFGHPENFRAPQTVRLHPSKPYFCFCPVVEEPFTLEPGAELESRYLVLTCDGPPDPKRMQHIYQAYSQPPGARWLDAE